MTPFRSTPAGFVARWAPVEREVLARVARDVADLLRADAGLPDDVTDADVADAGVAFTGVARVPRDPAVQRLLPDAHREDADVAAEFRHLTQTDLAAGKVARLRAFADTVDDGGAGAGSSDGQVVVARDTAQEFAGALTDVRLVLGERLGLDDDADVEHLHHEVLTGLGIVEDDDAEGADPDETDAAGLDAEQRSYWGGVFVAAGFAQESLMDELLAELRARGRGADE
ncbi:uncharacterized protein DUF2017 [Isoptericola sp. CG 20/1183]|uniref:Uncharacterized protein DUF2017 n=1 Tax=Isoptericola halotolerans TaxID=300560 RepID=A0ABX5EFV9_9MICO|nr:MULTISPECIES: DUF2017 family protein [Isoptericola]PRZ07651.1 uncharacterized protein DUF2017 [Isoptericola halotolerans]PRZ07990.1 uncharacterized protein DUF2017 [Isoptericola sp. CG 20/1183]